MTTLTDRAATIVHAVSDVVRSGVGCLADLIARIVNGLKTLAPVSLAIACQSGTHDAPVPPTPMPREMASPPPVAPTPDAGPTPLGEFNITFYYMIGEEEVTAKAAAKAAKAAANDNQTLLAATDGEPRVELAAVVTPTMVTLYASQGGGACEPITEVTKDFAAALQLQGTGKLKDGRVLNIWGQCACEHSPCFKVTASQWGTAGTGRPLQPFRTVAVDPKVIKLGTLLYVPLLEGRTMPGRSPWGGFVHDGCVVADDTGGGIDGNQLDLFVGRKGYYLGISGSAGSHAWARHVPVFDGTQICERKGRHVARKSGAI
jgi:3D (Asp-Asp-Asp) domain-containing protein